MDSSALIIAARRQQRILEIEENTGGEIGAQSTLTGKSQQDKHYDGE